MLGQLIMEISDKIDLIKYYYNILILIAKLFDNQDEW